MKVIFGLILAVAILFGFVALLVSHQSRPSERLKEAGAAAAGGALWAGGCILDLVISAVTFVLGLLLLGLILKSCL